mmetsp:Transcript_16548/g.29710  ORF Transcript_16548/g.29710 Transcript_16548/m.29710 type:complete len:444 (-) Transcript_16548:785-2116(-)
MGHYAGQVYSTGRPGLQIRLLRVHVSVPHVLVWRLGSFAAHFVAVQAHQSHGKNPQQGRPKPAGRRLVYVVGPNAGPGVIYGGVRGVFVGWVQLTFRLGTQKNGIWHVRPFAVGFLSQSPGVFSHHLPVDLSLPEGRQAAGGRGAFGMLVFSVFAVRRPSARVPRICSPRVGLLHQRRDAFDRRGNQRHRGKGRAGRQLSQQLLGSESAVLLLCHQLLQPSDDAAAADMVFVGVLLDNRQSFRGGRPPVPGRGLLRVGCGVVPHPRAPRRDRRLCREPSGRKRREYGGLCVLTRDRVGCVGVCRQHGRLPHARQLRKIGGVRSAVLRPGDALSPAHVLPDRQHHSGTAHCRRRPRSPDAVPMRSFRCLCLSPHFWVRGRGDSRSSRHDLLLLLHRQKAGQSVRHHKRAVVVPAAALASARADSDVADQSEPAPDKAERSQCTA